MIGWFSTFNIPRNTSLLQHKFQVLHTVFISNFSLPFFFVSKREIAIFLAMENDLKLLPNRVDQCSCYNTSGLINCNEIKR